MNADNPSSDHSPLAHLAIRDQRKRESIGSTEVMLAIITSVLLVGMLYIASSLFIPIVISALAYLTLRPIVARLSGLGLPHAIASGIPIVACFAIVGFIAILLYQPTQTWIAKAPQGIVKIRQNLASISKPLSILDRAQDQFSDAADQADDAGEPVKVAIQKPRFIDQTSLINKTGHLIAFIGAIAVLTFFMLSSGDELLNRILNALPDEARRKEVLSTTGEIQDSVGRYLSQVSCINIGLGGVTTLAMWLLGMPTPILWGVMAALFNFIPYVGPLAATVIVFLAAGSTFDTLGRAIGTAFVFWSLTAMEGQFITPSILGKTLRVGPVVVLVAVATWGFLWGIPGVFLAVPLLMVQREVLAAFDATYPLAMILGEDACTEKNDVDCQPVKEDQTIAESV